VSNVLAIRGASAELRWGYHKAARLGAWTVAGTAGAWTFTAAIVEHDAFKVSQRPLLVVTPNGWRWVVHTLQITGGALTASILPEGTQHGTVSHCST